MLPEMSDTVKMTQVARERLEAEAERLEGEARRDAAEKIGIARAEGDLSENAEYHAAKNDAAMLEAKIARIRDQLRSAEIVEEADGDAAGMGSTVTYEDGGKKREFKLVPASEADPGKGLLSIDSPMGSALSGARVGDTRSLETPRGARDVRIIAIENS
jgi:transcription elongation factor GreA